jgi:hypothetical protein
MPLNAEFESSLGRARRSCETCPRDRLALIRSKACLPLVRFPDALRPLTLADRQDGP